MKRILIITALLTVLANVPVRAAEVETVKAIATAYNLTGTTATGTQTTEGRTIAGKREWFGKVLVLWEDPDRSGKIKAENYIGTYICEDTGGKTVSGGQVVDVYMKSYEDCRNFGSKKVIIQIISCEDNAQERTTK